VSEQCKRYFDKISEYLDGELSTDICEIIERHMQDCPECRDCIASLRKTIALCKKASGEEISEEAKKRLRSALQEALTSPVS
jgi:anti-sigma factor RsiW